LIISTETPKSDTMTTSRSAAMASSAAVDEMVTNEAARSSASAIDPVLKRTAPPATRPSCTSSAQSSGYGQRS
jgi:hypothetical protein